MCKSSVPTYSTSCLSGYEFIRLYLCETLLSLSCVRALYLHTVPPVLVAMSLLDYIFVKHS